MDPSNLVLVFLIPVCVDIGRDNNIDNLLDRSIIKRYLGQRREGLHHSLCFRMSIIEPGIENSSTKRKQKLKCTGVGLSQKKVYWKIPNSEQADVS